MLGSVDLRMSVRSRSEAGMRESMADLDSGMVCPAGRMKPVNRTRE